MYNENGDVRTKISSSVERGSTDKWVRERLEQFGSINVVVFEKIIGQENCVAYNRKWCYFTFNTLNVQVITYKLQTQSSTLYIHT